LGLRVGGHDHVGEAFVDFQRELKALSRRGILLAIASKNEEKVALEAIEKHPEMILERDDFVGWRIDWEDKALNIVDLVAALNLGLRSVVFIDDSPAERSRVREALPEVLVPEWPVDPALYAAALRDLRCFDVPRISSVDRERTGMYAAERRRRELKKEVPSLEDWFRSLALRVRAEPLNAGNAPRASQLLDRTHQMNLTGRQLSAAELLAWAALPGREAWVFYVSDRFGDSGLTGLASLEEKERWGLVADFALSCRVMGRQVEEAMVHHLVERASARGLEQLRAECVPTPQNGPCLSFFTRRLPAAGAHAFSWELKRSFPLPPHIELGR
jgi:FkbH-like protein